MDVHVGSTAEDSYLGSLISLSLEKRLRAKKAIELRNSSRHGAIVRAENL